MDYDIAVVGGGPSGAATACWAARAGLNVTVLDKATFPRDKTCGDGLTAAALRELARLGVDVRAQAQTINATEVLGPYGVHITVPVREGLAPGAIMAAVVRRCELDADVLAVAADAGVKVHEGTAVRHMEVGAHGVLVRIEHDGTKATLTARYVVGADGAHSLVRRLAFPQESRRLPGIQAIREYVDAPESDRLSVYFLAELLPGYAWIFPLPGGGANVGLGVHRDPDVMGRMCRAALTTGNGRVALGGLSSLYEAFVQRPDIVGRLGPRDPNTIRLHAWPIPTDPDLTHVATSRVLLVGDAARLADPLTGEGIGQGLLSARLAAEAIAEGRGPLSTVLGYRTRLERELGRDLRFGRLLVRALRHRRGAEWAFQIAGTTAWTRRNVARWMYEDYPRAHVFTPGRWREHGMRGTGAYGTFPPKEPPSTEP